MPLKPLLQEGIEAGQPDPDVAKAVAHLPAEDPGGEPDERDHRERHEREPPVDGEHHRHDRDQRERVAEDGHDPRGEQLVERLHVRGDPGHQPADRVSVEVADAEALQVREDLASGGRT